MFHPENASVTEHLAEVNPDEGWLAGGDGLKTWGTAWASSMSDSSIKKGDLMAAKGLLVRILHVYLFL